VHAGPTIFDEVGGLPFFEALVDRFYDGVASDPELLRVYPSPEDLTFARRKLSLFLADYWGVTTAYSELRGHPGVRMGHAVFPVGSAERDRGLGHLRRAV